MTAEPQAEFALPGLEGSNPLAFLAALGVVHAASITARPDGPPRLQWTPGTFAPTLRVAGPSLDRPALVEQLLDILRRLGDPTTGIAGFADIIGVESGVFDGHVHHALHALSAGADPDGASHRLRFAAAYGSGSITDGKSGKVVPTALSFANGQSGKKLLKDFRTLAGRLTADRLAAALFQPWAYDDVDQPTLRWDPLDLRTYAHMATDPGAADTQSVMAANALAFVGLGLLPSVPTNHGLRTAGVVRKDRVTQFALPLWDAPLTVDAITGLLCQDWTAPANGPETRRARGIIAVFACRRTVANKGVYFSPAVAV